MESIETSQMIVAINLFFTTGLVVICKVISQKKTFCIQLALSNLTQIKEPAKCPHKQVETLQLNVNIQSQSIQSENITIFWWMEGHF